MESFSLKLSLGFILLLNIVVVVYSADLCPCDHPQTDVPKGNFDTCTAAGTYKSKSICYTNAAGTSIVYPYEFYTCVPYSTSYILYPRKCNVKRWVVPDTTLTTSMFRFFNPYNEATGLCDVPVPAGALDPANTTQVAAPGGTMLNPKPTVCTSQ